MLRLTALVALVSALLVISVAARSYKEGDDVPFKVNKIGPFDNPQETYDYYSLPFCRPEQKSDRHVHANIKDELSGDHWAAALYTVQFRDSFEHRALCSVKLTPEKVRGFKRAISRFFYFEMVYDDIPVHGFIGTVDRQASPPRFFLYKHLHFSFFYNGPHVIFANATADWRYIHQLPADPATLSDAELGAVDFSYSASWQETTVSYEDRHALLNQNFLKQHDLDVQWLSIMNSFVLSVLLVGFLTIIIMRVLKSDYTRYSAEEGDGEEEYGWKLVHGDVFRFPPYKMLLSALLGNGIQFLVLTTLLLSLAAFGLFYEGYDNNLRLVAIIMYVFTCGVAGYAASSFYKKIGGTSWVWCIILTSFLFVLPVALITVGLNLFSVYYPGHLTITLSFTTMGFFFLLWAVISVPTTLVGGIAGRRMTGEFDAPVRTKNFAREIPALPWYRDAAVAFVIAGFLPFSAIYIEVYYLLLALSGHSSSPLFAMLFLVFILLLIVTSCIVIALIYFQLSMEDYRWWWRSFFYGSSCSFFLFCYTWYFYWSSRMSGVLQMAYFFGSMITISWYFFIMLGTLGFVSSLTFIRYIYSRLRIN